MYRYDAATNTLQKPADTNMYSYRHLKVADNDRKEGRLPPAPTPTIMRICSIKKDGDGAVYLFAQEQYDEIFSSGRAINPSGIGMHQEDATHLKPASMDESTVKHYDDIAAACIRPDGQLKWIVAIPQKHAGRGVANSLGFGTYIHNNTCYIMYMSNRRNLKREEGEELVQHMDGADDAYLTVASIHKNGSVTKQALMEEVSDRKNFDAAGILPVSGQKIMVRGYGGHLEKTDRIQFDILELPND